MPSAAATPRAERSIYSLRSWFLLCSLICAGIAQADVCRVATDATPFGDGASWDSPMLLHEALSATACTEIWVAAGVYTPSTTDRSVSFAIARELQLYGGFSGAETAREQRDPKRYRSILSGDIGDDDVKTLDVTETAAGIVGGNSYHVLALNGQRPHPITAASVIDGFIITGGQGGDTHPASAGGGLLCDGFQFDPGDGDCSPTLRNLRFSGNHALEGGAVFLSWYSRALISGVTFSGNHAVNNGGALSIDGTGSDNSPTLVNVTFSGNSSGNSGGAIKIDGSGGIANPVLNHVTFSGNHAGNAGGAIHGSGDIGGNGVSQPVLTHVILWDNDAEGRGANLFNAGPGTHLMLRHSLLQGGCSAVQESFDSTTDCSSTFNADPRLASLQDNGGSTPTLFPRTGSAAIDIGDAPSCASVDQRGIPRPQGAGCDIGAVEWSDVIFADGFGYGGPGD